MFKDFQIAEAHCDIPCKIYDPAISQVAALSVVRLIDLLHEIDESDNSLKSIAHRSRLVIEKEAQAKIVKNEVNIIWGDYFKAPQIESHPNVHTLVHEIMMQLMRIIYYSRKLAFTHQLAQNNLGVGQDA